MKQLKASLNDKALIIRVATIEVIAYIYIYIYKYKYKVIYLLII